MDDLLQRRVRTVLRRIAPTHREAAATIGMEPTKLSKSLNGIRRLTLEELTAMADAGGVSVDWLVHGRGNPPVTVASSPLPSDDERMVEDHRRQQYLEAAWRLISEKGFHNVRVADIARACGTSTGAVHYHFPGKRDVLEAAMRYCVEQAFTRQSAELRAEDDAHRRLLRLIDNQVPGDGQVDREWRVWLQFWGEAALRGDLRPIHNDFYARWRDTVVRIIERGMRQGVFRQVDPVEVALTFTSLTDGLGIQVMTGNPEVTAERMRAILVAFVERELLARNGGGA
jgi:AcrR family transcriptional regulator